MLSDMEKRKLEAQFSFNTSLFWGHTLSYPTPSLACVYAFEMSDNTVKIGVTRNVKKRAKSVASAVYLDVLRIHQTDFAPFHDMVSVEQACHAAFADRRVRGEIFNISFAEACAELDRHADEIAILLKSADEKYIEESTYYNALREAYRQEQNIAATLKTHSEMLELNVALSKIVKTADILQTSFGLDRCAALKTSIDVVEWITGIKFSRINKMLPFSSYATDYLNTEQIGEQLGGISRQAVKKLLEKGGWQRKQGSDWRLTESGKTIGAEAGCVWNYHRGYAIRWHKKIVDILKKYMRVA